jgi:hypothetical protein
MIFQLWKNSETNRTLSGARLWVPYRNMCLFWVHNHSPSARTMNPVRSPCFSRFGISSLSLPCEDGWARFFGWDRSLWKSMSDMRIPYPGSPANFEDQRIPLAWDEFNMKHHGPKSPRLLGFDNTSSSTFSGPLCAPVVVDKTVSFYSTTVVSKLKWGFTLQWKIDYSI